jgi:hypothetical protein
VAIKQTSPEKAGAVGVLKAFAKRHRARVSGFNLHDPNVCTSTFDWREGFDSRPVPSDRFRHRLKMKRGGVPIEIYSNDRFIQVSARGGSGSELPFSINRPDRIVLLKRRCQIPGAKRWRVYVASGARVPPALRHQRVRKAIDRLDLGPHDSLHVYANGLTVYVRPGSIERVAGVVAGVASLAKILKLKETPATPFSDLPEKFRPLIRLIRTWSNSDDLERSERMEKAPRQRLQRLVDEVEPHFRSINAYLDSFTDDALSESAAALGMLAEAAAEARLILEQGQKTRKA